MMPRALFAVLALGTSARAGHLAASARDVQVVAFDYAFKLPAKLPAGYARFVLMNRGRKRHEFNIVLLKRGATVREFMDSAMAGKPVGPLMEASVGVLFAPPGKRSASALSTNLQAGRTYAILCVARDSATAPTHVALGMSSALHVGSADPRQTVSMRADTIVVMDYAYQYQRTLSPGLHRLVFVNTGKQRHEMNIARLKPGVTLDQVRAVDKVRGRLRPLVDQSLGVLFSRGGSAPAGALEIEFIRGRTYLFECGFRDDDKAPPHYTLGMYGAIAVGAK